MPDLYHNQKHLEIIPPQSGTLAHGSNAAFDAEVVQPCETRIGNELVVRKSTSPTAQKMCRAAQYVRMSTERQQYSIQNQAAVIAAYAHSHNLTIVRTYRDEGESGLLIKNRTGLLQLLEDVQAGETDFGHILVYGVSRWGRFQDVDESAHYEFICRRVGIKVAYCAEQFDKTLRRRQTNWPLPGVLTGGTTVEIASRMASELRLDYRTPATRNPASVAP